MSNTRFVVYDSDGNLIGIAPTDAANVAERLGRIIVDHYDLVDDTSTLNRELDIPDADEPFVTVRREVEP